MTTILSDEMVEANLRFAVTAAARALTFTAVSAGPLERLESPQQLLPAGAPQLVRATLGGDIGCDLLIQLTEDFADRAREAAGNAEGLAEAMSTLILAVASDLTARTSSAVVPSDVLEVSVAHESTARGAQSFGAVLLERSEPIGAIVFVFSPESAAMQPPLAGDDSSVPHVTMATFPDATEPRAQTSTASPLSLLRGVEMKVTAELGRARLDVANVLNLTPGSIVELDRVAGTPLDVLVNGTVIAYGEVVVIDDEYGVRITEIVAGPEDH